jgi:hypothetical protein
LLFSLISLPSSFSGSSYTSFGGVVFSSKGTNDTGSVGGTGFEVTFLPFFLFFLLLFVLFGSATLVLLYPFSSFPKENALILGPFPDGPGVLVSSF